ncbi:putative addiction module antidote [Rhizobium sp. RU20A]|uniref:AbrB/MazE/SpoVT family DNA-binding domain-containing protein n=1 Tax=Rhizobium sp. RU20A TaxID=1907412 RepID=UPI00095512ED|nr:AbrB/MazE/SpoVT family DNA-binding domain-containing protein [Rhizobium sp. RU20A]SIP94951.1 putative addiction module antidote [Rhizobium sp. RU20A]
MNVTVRKIGNSEGIIIPKDMLESLGVKAGDTLQVERDGQSIRLTASDADFQRQLDHAQVFMDRYKVALKKLAE